MRLSTRRLSAVVITVLISTVGLSACGLGEKAANKAVEKAVEKSVEGDGDVDINTEDGSFTVENEDGKMSFGVGDVPEEFPQDVPLPVGEYTVSTSSVQGDEIMVMLTMPFTDLDELVTYFADELASAGYTVGDKSQYTAEDMAQVTMIGTNAERQVTISMLAIRDEQVTVTYGVAKVE